MNSYQTIETEQHHHIATVYLNRPEVRNAINETMIAELIDAFEQLGKSDDVRVITLRGKGTVFCGGADLNWMKDIANYSYEQNQRESAQLAKCFSTIYKTPKPTIAVVQGAAMGGANGLLAACDFAFTTDETFFAFSEVRIGLIPATIAPYILNRTGQTTARDLMLTGRRIKGNEAAALGLVNKAVHQMELETTVAATIEELLTAAPASIAQCKELLNTLIATNQEQINYTVDMIAAARVSAEGQEGMKAFLEKRKPNWIK